MVVLLASLVKGAALVLVSAIFVSIEGFWIGAGLVYNQGSFIGGGACAGSFRALTTR